jgi:hypothetical protein
MMIDQMGNIKPEFSIFSQSPEFRGLRHFVPGFCKVSAYLAATE